MRILQIVHLTCPTHFCQKVKTLATLPVYKHTTKVRIYFFKHVTTNEPKLIPKNSKNSRNKITYEILCHKESRCLTIGVLILE